MAHEKITAVIDAIDGLIRALEEVPAVNFAELVQTLREWRATAEIEADPELARSLKEPLLTPTDARAVPRP